MHEEIDISKMTRDKVVPYYVDLIKRYHIEYPEHYEEVKEMNEKILSKWKPSGLIYIKEKAWKLLENKA